MPTSSLGSVGALLGASTLAGMAAVLRMPRPISARAIRSLASSEIVSAWELLTPFGIAKDTQNAVWHAGHLTDALALDSASV